MTTLLRPPFPPTGLPPGQQIFIDCTIGSLETGFTNARITPREIITAALSGLTPNERLALVGIAKNSETGEFIVETNDGPQRLIPLPA